MTQIPRPEHPRPGFVRKSWQNLNGTWEFYNDVSASGEERKVYEADKFDGKIVVPFCPESKLSGVGNLDFMPSVWYARQLKVDKKMLEGRVLLHFGACDYKTTVYMGGKVVGTHVGGYTPFTVDITDSLRSCDTRLVVHAEDNLRSGTQPCGKQSREYYSHNCDYTRTTGIWQTVWLEFVPETYIENIRITATDLSGAVKLQTKLSRYAENAQLCVVARLEGKTVAGFTFDLGGVVTEQSFTVDTVKLWNVGEPNLYDVTFTLKIGGKAVDTVDGYFGIRRIDVDGYKIRINGKSVFQRLVLDQGFYPDGIYTAPSDEALRHDIELSQAAGFNGARLHQKVFEERFLYHADRMGYIVWGEYGSWGVKISEHETLHTFLPQWLESVERDYNRPSVIGWCAFNETWDDNRKTKMLPRKEQIDSNISVVYEATKRVDPTRLCIDTSGSYHTGKTDIYDVHDYNQDPECYKEIFSGHARGEFFNNFTDRQTYDGIKPYMLSEYGGIKWAGGDTSGDRLVSWGYGDVPETVDEFVSRLCGLTAPILAAPNICGYCYTQLTDVEQEQNGIYYYDRSPKFDAKVYEKIRDAFAAPAAIEKE